MNLGFDLQLRPREKAVTEIARRYTGFVHVFEKA